MDQLREGIGLRAYGQKDPLLEYQQEAYEAFKSLLATIDDEILSIVYTKPRELREGPEVLVTPAGREPIEMATVHESAVGMGFAGGGERPDVPPKPVQAGKKQPVKVEDTQKIGRNDPCYCGSGKKFKHCHGKNY
jgi:preprotein translocase subunit SecA